MKVPDLTEAEMKSINDLSKSMRTLGEIFTEDEGTPAMLRVGVAVVRESADVLEGLAARWEASLVQDQ
jgi:hypothetical protein